MRKNFLIRQTTPVLRLAKKDQKSSKGGADNYFKNIDPFIILKLNLIIRGGEK